MGLLDCKRHDTSAHSFRLRVRGHTFCLRQNQVMASTSTSTARPMGAAMPALSIMEPLCPGCPAWSMALMSLLDSSRSPAAMYRSSRSFLDVFLTQPPKNINEHSSESTEGEVRGNTRYSHSTFSPSPGKKHLFRLDVMFVGHLHQLGDEGAFSVVCQWPERRVRLSDDVVFGVVCQLRLGLGRIEQRVKNNLVRRGLPLIFSL